MADEGRKAGRGVRAGLWLLAFVAMVVVAGYQRRTGPTHPFRTELAAGGEVHRVKLVRSGNTDADARAEVPAPQGVTGGEIFWRRYPSADDFQSKPMAREGEVLVGLLPRQPAAGKLEYYVVVAGPEGPIRIPALGEGTGGSLGNVEDSLIIRFKDPVPAWVLVPHILMMFSGMLVGVRTIMAAALLPREVRRLTWATLGLLTLGGMVLGPCVQKYAFGEFWTGFPFGYDLTDNKTLIMWLGWVVAALVVGRGERGSQPSGRVCVILAGLIMLVVYSIPHSLRGSELDYSQVEQGVSPEAAIQTGR